MSTFVITDATVHAAFTQLSAHVHPAAVARADRERAEDAVKAAKAKAFLATEGTVAEREATAILSREYKEAQRRYYAAIEIDEEYRNLRSKAEMIIEAWRTTAADRRAAKRSNGGERSWPE